MSKYMQARANRPPNPHYTLRKQNQTSGAITRPQAHPAQRQKDQYARMVKDRWPTTRVSKNSRGIWRKSDRNDCFRLVAIQSLLHLPKFMNWILSHDEQGKFPCDKEVKAEYDDNCPACLFKELIRFYWGNCRLHRDGTPKALGASDSHVRKLHGIDDFISDADNLQQDAEECQTRLLEACLKSVSEDHTDWTNQYISLFNLDPIVRRECECRHIRLVPELSIPQIGFPSIPVRSGSQDTLQEALSRANNFKVELPCPKCGNKTVTETLRIQGAPEILRIKLNTYEFDLNTYTMREITPPIQFPKVLSLTQYLEGTAQKLTYRLSSVMLHQGEAGCGHWVIAARGPKDAFAINDGYCVGEKISELNRNPHLLGSGYAEEMEPFSASTLMYVRIHLKDLVKELQ